MLWIDENSAEAYLRAGGYISPNASVAIRELAGGVSNVVLLVSKADGEPLFVLKQARQQLRVADPWFCSVTRILREVDVLTVCHEVLSGAPQEALLSGSLRVAVPKVLFCDVENYAFAMTAAPPHQVWKQQLLAGHCDERVAAACGSLLGQLHARTWNDSSIAQRLGDRTFFEQLRVDPYYRHVLRHRPALAPPLEQLIDSLDQHLRCLVHGDFSPKNLLVFDSGLLLVDCEVGHFGDPAFDLGFFLSHLLLKALRAQAGWAGYVELTEAFWAEYERYVHDAAGGEEYRQLVQRAIANCAGCLLARIDGKSKVDYLAEPERELARRGGEVLLQSSVATWPAAVRALTPCFESAAARAGNPPAGS